MPLCKDYGALYRHALQNEYILPACHAWGLESLKAILTAAVEMRSPVIIQLLTATMNSVGPLPKLIRCARDYAEDADVPVLLNFDHAPSVEAAKAAVDMGMPSVMFDGSAFPLEKNIATTRDVVEYAHTRGVWVEAELGSIPGMADLSFTNGDRYTKPEEAARFIRETGCDALAVAVGTAHGGVRAPKPLEIDFVLLDEIRHAVSGTPLVLHGAASLPKEEIDQVNRYGGEVEYLMMCREETIAETRHHGVAKVNMDVDNWLRVAATLRRQFVEQPSLFDPITYMGRTIGAMADAVAHKMKRVTMSAGFADTFSE